MEEEKSVYVCVRVCAVEAHNIVTTPWIHLVYTYIFIYTYIQYYIYIL